MDLSVIIVNYNVRFFLEQCLNSVRRASAGISCEVFVVDNNSADGSCSMVINQFPEVNLIRNNKNIGFSAANNMAIKLATGKYILILNPDTFVEEDTFVRCIRFMDEHRDAGALGVRMINGSGKILPESKRGIPTPGAALFKMSGLYAIFPKSPRINRYYLGHLDDSVTTEIEIISGAFMFLRKEALDKTGLLDESFFMYGEDIDLSYRMILAGYKNYYLPEVKIIHYKGESTKKGDLNYTVIFFKAMIIFVEKYFAGKKHFLFLFFINTAIYFWGLVTVIKKISRHILLPLIDSAVIAGILSLFIRLWGQQKFGNGYHYPIAFTLTALVGFTASSLVALYLSGGYKIPARLADTFRGILIASGFILAIYSVLPLEMRFSRAVILCGISTYLLVLPLYRLAFALAGSGIVTNPFKKANRIIIAGDRQDYESVVAIISQRKNENNVVGRASIIPGDTGPEVLGSLDQIEDIVKVNKVSEIIFSTGKMTSANIINAIYNFAGKNVAISIAPPGEGIIIGSGSLEFAKDSGSVT
jgi:O-antigen biosynthesis protein